MKMHPFVDIFQERVDFRDIRVDIFVKRVKQINDLSLFLYCLTNHHLLPPEFLFFFQEWSL